MPYKRERSYLDQEITCRADAPLGPAACRAGLRHRAGRHSESVSDAKVNLPEFQQECSGFGFVPKEVDVLSFHDHASSSANQIAALNFVTPRAAGDPVYLDSVERRPAMYLVE
jgi:hypothetical protein